LRALLLCRRRGADHAKVHEGFVRRFAKILDAIPGVVRFLGGQVIEAGRQGRRCNDQHGRKGVHPAGTGRTCHECDHHAHGDHDADSDHTQQGVRGNE
jgi:hypothetical protein